MSGTYKQYTLNNKTDFIIYMRSLIIQTDKWIAKYNEYLETLEQKIVELDLVGNPKQKVESCIYEDNNSKLQYAGNKLLNLFGDLADGAMSYYRFRKKLINRNIEVKNILGSFSNDVALVLKNFNISRNWGLHEPESLLNSQIESLKKWYPPSAVNEFKNVFNPIQVPYFNYYEGTWILSLYKECSEIKEGHQIIFESMINDYEKLIDTKPLINRNNIHLRSFESEFDIPKISLVMQNNRYKKP